MDVLNFLSTNDFLNSNFFIACITLIVGFLAFGLYFKQKSDKKRDASKIILSEIVNSEKIIKEVKEIKKLTTLAVGNINIGPDPMKFHLGVLSWNKYKYLFIGDFESYEWEKVNLFFAKCQTFNNAIKGIADLMPQNIEYRMQFLQQGLAKFASERADEITENQKGKEKTEDEKKNIIDKFEKKSNYFADTFINGKDTQFLRFTYLPLFAFEPLEKELDNIDTELSESSIGKKLLKLNHKFI